MNSVKLLVWSLFGLLTLFNVLDAWQTHLLLTEDFIELNPLVDFALRTVNLPDFWTIMLVKLVPIGFLGYVTHYTLKRNTNEN